MIEHVSPASFDGMSVPGAKPVAKKAGLWTPWGNQRVPDLDKVLASPSKWAARRAAVAASNRKDAAPTR